MVSLGDLSLEVSDSARMDSTPAPKPRPKRGHLFRDFQVEATAFLHEILLVAERLKEARAFDGEPALHLNPRSRLLRTIERCGGAPTFSDIARLLKISRQTAREQALATAEAGLVELFPAPDDRRLWQVAVTPAGRRALEEQRMPPFAWLFTLLDGLEPNAMRSTQHVLHVVRLRLERYEQERRRVAARSAARWPP